MIDSYRSQRGEGKIQMVIWLVLFGFFIFAIVKFVPVKMHIMELEQKAEDMVRSAVNAPGGRKSPEEVQKDVRLLAQDELGLDLDDDDITCSRTGSSGFVVTVDGEVPIDFLFYTYTQKVKFEVSSRAF